MKFAVHVGESVVKAVGLMVHGGPEVLEVVDVEEVTAGPGQIRIRNYAAAVNPTDIVARDGTRAKLQSQFPPPYVPGMDARGLSTRWVKG